MEEDPDAFLTDNEDPSVSALLNSTAGKAERSFLEDIQKDPEHSTFLSSMRNYGKRVEEKKAPGAKIVGPIGQKVRERSKLVPFGTFVSEMANIQKNGKRFLVPMLECLKSILDCLCLPQNQPLLEKHEKRNSVFIHELLLSAIEFGLSLENKELLKTKKLSQLTIAETRSCMKDFNGIVAETLKKLREAPDTQRKNHYEKHPKLFDLILLALENEIDITTRENILNAIKAYFVALHSPEEAGDNNRWVIFARDAFGYCKNLPDVLTLLQELPECPEFAKEQIRGLLALQKTEESGTLVMEELPDEKNSEEITEENEPTTPQGIFKKGLAEFNRSGVQKAGNKSDGLKTFFTQLCDAQSREPLLRALRLLYIYYMENPSERAFLGRMIRTSANAFLADDDELKKLLNAQLLNQNDKDKALILEERRLYCNHFFVYINITLGYEEKKILSTLQAIFAAAVNDKTKTETQKILFDLLSAFFRNDAAAFDKANAALLVADMPKNVTAEKLDQLRSKIGDVPAPKTDLLQQDLSDKKTSTILQTCEDYAATTKKAGADYPPIAKLVAAFIRAGQVERAIEMLNYILNYKFPEDKIKTSAFIGCIIIAIAPLVLSQDELAVFNQQKQKKKIYKSFDATLRNFYLGKIKAAADLAYANANNPKTMNLQEIMQICLDDQTDPDRRKALLEAVEAWLINKDADALVEKAKTLDAGDRTLLAGLPDVPEEKSTQILQLETPKKKMGLAAVVKKGSSIFSRHSHDDRNSNHTGQMEETDPLLLADGEAAAPASDTAEFPAHLKNAFFLDDTFLLALRKLPEEFKGEKALCVALADMTKRFQQHGLNDAQYKSYAQSLLAALYVLFSCTLNTNANSAKLLKSEFMEALIHAVGSAVLTDRDGRLCSLDEQLWHENGVRKYYLAHFKNVFKALLTVSPNNLVMLTEIVQMQIDTPDSKLADALLAHFRLLARPTDEAYQESLATEVAELSPDFRMSFMLLAPNEDTKRKLEEKTVVSIQKIDVIYSKLSIFEDKLKTYASSDTANVRQTNLELAKSLLELVKEPRLLSNTEKNDDKKHKQMVLPNLRAWLLCISYLLESEKDKKLKSSQFLRPFIDAIGFSTYTFHKELNEAEGKPLNVDERKTFLEEFKAHIIGILEEVGITPEKQSSLAPFFTHIMQSKNSDERKVLLKVLSETLMSLSHGRTERLTKAIEACDKNCLGVLATLNLRKVLSKENAEIAECFPEAPKVESTAAVAKSKGTPFWKRKEPKTTASPSEVDDKEKGDIRETGVANTGGSINSGKGMSLSRSSESSE